MWTGFSPNGRAARLSQFYSIGPYGSGDMKQHYGLIKVLRKSAYSLDGFNLGDLRSRLRVISRRDISHCKQLFLGIGNYGIIFGMDPNQNAIFARAV